MDDTLCKNEVVESLWNAYKKTREYKRGLTEGIPSHHQLVEKQETLGLKRVYEHFILKSFSVVEKRVETSNVEEWLSEWKSMQDILFQYVLINRGEWRKKNVRIGDPYDDTLTLPDHKIVPHRIRYLAEYINSILKKNNYSEDEKLHILANVHFKFVMVHPFNDGNGRIARALTDQISLFFGFPPAIVGYPRHSLKQQAAYHQAIYLCAKNGGVEPLAIWIKSFIYRQLEKIA